MNLSLDLYMTDKCNMRCDYCYHRNDGRHSLGYDDLKRAAHHALGIGCNVISFLGGEPLLEAENLTRLVRHIRRKSASTKLIVYTNGTLLKDDIVGTLNSGNVHVFLSLDGDFKTFCRHRSLKNRTKGQSEKAYNDIVRTGRALDNGQIMIYIANDREHSCGLARNIKRFTKNGFYKFGLEFERFCDWDRTDFDRLDRQISSLEKQIRLARKDRGAVPLILNVNDARERLPKVLEKRIWWRDCDKLILGEDGKYYVCDKVFMLPPDMRAQAEIGDIRSGPDLKKRDKMLEEACDGVVSRTQDPHLFFYCPMGAYFANKWLGGDLDRRLSGLLNISKYLYTALHRLHTAYTDP